MVFAYLKFCACYGVSKLEFLTACNGSAFPCWKSPATIRISDHGQMKTRVEAFIEVLNERRSDRVAAAVAAD